METTQYKSFREILEEKYNEPVNEFLLTLTAGILLAYAAKPLFDSAFFKEVGSGIGTIFKGIGAAVSAATEAGKKAVEKIKDAKEKKDAEKKAKEEQQAKEESLKIQSYMILCKSQANQIKDPDERKRAIDSLDEMSKMTTDEQGKPLTLSKMQNKLKSQGLDENGLKKKYNITASDGKKISWVGSVMNKITGKMDDKEIKEIIDDAKVTQDLQSKQKKELDDLNKEKEDKLTKVESDEEKDKIKKEYEQKIKDLQQKHQKEIQNLQKKTSKIEPITTTKPKDGGKGDGDKPESPKEELSDTEVEHNGKKTKIIRRPNLREPGKFVYCYANDKKTTVTPEEGGKYFKKKATSKNESLSNYLKDIYYC